MLRKGAGLSRVCLCLTSQLKCPKHLLLLFGLAIFPTVFFFFKVKHRPLCFMSCQLSGLLPSPLTTSQLQQMERSTFVQGGLGHGVCLCASVGAPCRGSPVEGRTTATLPGRSFKPPPPTSNLRLILHSTAKSDNNFSAPNPGTELYSLQSPFYSQSLI